MIDKMNKNGPTDQALKQTEKLISENHKDIEDLRRSVFKSNERLRKGGMQTVKQICQARTFQKMSNWLAETLK